MRVKKVGRLLFPLCFTFIVLLSLITTKSRITTLLHVQQWRNDKDVNLKERANPTIKTRAVRGETFLSPYVNRYLRFNHGHKEHSSNGKTHLILWWNEPKWMKVSRWNTYCNMSQCEYVNCVVIGNRNYIDNSSALIVSIAAPGADQLPVQRAQRNPDQAWVFFTLESPMSFWNRAFEKDEWRSVFNWSMTYRRDADIFIPYGWLGDRKTSLNKNYSDIFRKKTREVAWIVSHCQTSGKREQYVQELQKYIQVDIYGRCGTKVTDNALYKLLPEYKFYLGFENALCKDYMTEKFFHYFMYDLIVIVRGLTDYGKHLPNNTFINSADFSSIQSLGQYLTRLAKDEEQYIQYLKEKDKYDVLERQDTYCEALCSICEKVNHVEKNRRTYDRIFDWTGFCEDPKDIK